MALRSGSRLSTLRRSAYVLPLLASIVAALFAILEGSPLLLSPGALSKGHAILSEDCRSCHDLSFGGLRALTSGSRAKGMNGACLNCHGHVIGGSAIALDVWHGRGEQVSVHASCNECHAGHGAQSSTQGSEQACSSCHAAATPAIGSLAQHPDFAPAVAGDPGTLHFNHALHGAQGLSCSSCHQSEPGATRGHRRGQYQAPIEFARDCQRCHGLDVPHEAKYAAEPACAKCHRVDQAGGGAAIAPTAVPRRWYEKANFDHGRHTAIAFGRGAGSDAECAICHASVPTSTRAADVGVPRVEVCRQCHGGEGGASDGCTTCHTFHSAPDSRRVDYGTLDPALVAAGHKETRYGLRSGVALWPISAFFALPKAVWGRPELAPGSAAFERELFTRYGLFSADFDNDGLPLGLLRVDDEFDGEPGLTVTCELCHSSSLFGRIVVGQPNRFSNFELLWHDLGVASGERRSDPLYFKNPPRNTVVNGADHLGLVGLMIRNPDLSIDLGTALSIAHERAMELKPEFDALAYVKTPPWYTYRTKQSGAAAYYHDGGHPKGANFAAFTYLTTFYDLDGDDLRAALSAWQRSGHVFLASLTPPRYPFPVDRQRAERGRVHYGDLCAGCHGEYDGAATPDNLRYPGLIVPAAEIGTDALRADFPAAFGERLRAILRERYVRTGGYVAPPLTAVWAQAPYLHNGSVPTLADLLEPARRNTGYHLVADPNDPHDFLQREVGWRTEALPSGNPIATGARAYDPAVVPGLGNQGHDYGAELTDEERGELIEFLKTL